MQEAQLFSHLVDQQAVVGVKGRRELQLALLRVLQETLHLLFDFSTSLPLLVLLQLLLEITGVAVIAAATTRGLLLPSSGPGRQVLALLLAAAATRRLDLDHDLVLLLSGVVLRHNILEVLKGTSDLPELGHVTDKGLEEGVILDGLGVTDHGDVSACASDGHVDPAVLGQEAHLAWDGVKEPVNGVLDLKVHDNRPKVPFLLERTSDSTTASFSRPWKPSTDLISSSGCFAESL